jgi:hypothetical protein
VLQNLQESFALLGRLVDIDRIVASTTGFDWAGLVDAARRGGIASPTALSLQLARRLLGTNVPEGVLRQLLPPPVSRFHLSIMDPEDCVLRQSLRGTYAPSKLFELWLIRGFGQRTRQLCRELGSDELSIISNRDPVGLVSRLVRMGKLGAMQLFAYASALVSQGTRRGRRRTRFWSDTAGYLP